LERDARCQGGTIVVSGIALAEAAVAQDADAVVVELGTNDFSPAPFRGCLIQALHILASVPLVIWQTARGAEGDESIRAVNEAIREIVPTCPNVAIADWEAFVPEEALQEDGIHSRRGLRTSGVRAPGPDALGVARRPYGEGGDILRPGDRSRDVLSPPEREKAGGAGIKRLVCIVLGPPDLTWPGGLSMPPAARLARGFCSPRSYLSIAPSKVHPRDVGPQSGSSGSRGGRMLQQVRESFRPVGRFERHARGHGSRDEEDLPLDHGHHPAGPPPDHRIEPADRTIQTPHHGELRAAPIPVLRERDDLSHGSMMGAASDMPGRWGTLGDADRVDRRQPLAHREPGGP
jgi:hypothetical protein